LIRVYIIVPPEKCNFKPYVYNFLHNRTNHKIQLAIIITILSITFNILSITFKAWCHKAMYVAVYTYTREM
jgi:hypothetical protein